ncbi:uncharacterized protein LOC141645844 [Silene latifolia]|uniref:uncharacterized protein LOC141645844 n=1 Tax=Silene latifolia TaxID=37657 RepID=UPI003D76F593
MSMSMAKAIAMATARRQEKPATDPNDPKYNFYVKMKPLRTLKLAIEALLEPTFKDDDDPGFGIVGVTTDSLVISVTNKDKNATAALSLNSSGMIHFRNNVPLSIVRFWAPLRLISHGLPRKLDGDDDTLTIFHVRGTNQLSFRFGTVFGCVFWAEIVEIPNATMFPLFTVLHETTVPAKDIREMIDCALQTRDLVNVNWKADFATFEIGSDKKWAYDYSQNAVREPTELKNEDTYQAEFNWSYTSLMKEVSFLSDKVSVHFLTVPEEHVLFKFHIGELGDFMLIKKAFFEVPDMNMNTDGDACDSITLETVSIS